MVKNIDFQNLAIETNNISMNLNDLNEVKNALEVMHVRGRSREIVLIRNQVNVHQNEGVSDAEDVDMCGLSAMRR